MNLSINVNHQSLTNETRSSASENNGQLFADEYSTEKHSAEEALFQRLLDGHSNEQHSMGERFYLPFNPTKNVTTSHANLTNGNTKALSIGSSISQVVSHISSAIAEVSLTQSTAGHSFTLMIPGQGNLNVNTTLISNNLRSFQLSSDDKKFQDWIDRNTQDIAEALAVEIGSEVSLNTGGYPT